MGGGKAVKRPILTPTPLELERDNIEKTLPSDTHVVWHYGMPERDVCVYAPIPVYRIWLCLIYIYTDTHIFILISTYVMYALIFIFILQYIYTIYTYVCFVYLLEVGTPPF